ncbi:MAG: hypothetical protein SFX73_16000 [Kofleriaceae bacterium]|nr:hypothetical protein [Kofleriaceae bacterium]
MKTAKTISILASILFAAASGCAAPAPDEEGGGGGGGGGGGDGGGDETQPLDVAGKYSMRSNFDIATNAPGKVGDVVNSIIDMTDDADDPANFLLTLMIDQISSSTVRNALNNVKPFVAGYLNDRLLDFAPDFVDTAIQLGNDFGQLAKNFGVNETLEISGAIEGLAGKKIVLGAHFKIDNMESDHLFADHQMENITVDGIGITLDQSRINLGQHVVPLPYGKILRIGLDEAIIPILEPGADNLAELLAAKINCQSVGALVDDAVYDAVGFSPGAGIFTTACNAGLVVAANKIYEKVEDIDGTALDFSLTGTARAVDANNDRKADKLQSGTYTGNLSYGGSTPAPLSTATFYGERM